MNHSIILPEPPRTRLKRQTPKFGKDVTIIVLGLFFLALPLVIGWDRLNSVRSSRGAPLGEAALVVGGICLAFGVLDFFIRLVIYLVRRTLNF